MTKKKSRSKTWQKVKLGDILELKYGFGLTEKNRIPGDVPVYGSSGIVGMNNKKRVDSPGIIIGRKGNVGSVYYSDKPFYPIDTVYYVDSLKIPGDMKFFYYLLKRIPFKKIGSDVGVPGLNRDIAYGLDITIPVKVEYQKRIASILSAFDDKIELNNKISQNLEQTAQAIFKEWFVKFKFPGHEKVKMINSELGKIPEGWKIGKINDLVSIISGYPFSSKLYNSSKNALGVVTIKNVQDGNFVKTCDSFIRKDDLPSKFNQDCNLADGDILLSLTGNVGRVCFVYGGEYLLNQRVAKIRPKNQRDFTFSYFLFRQAMMQNYLINMAKGSAQPNLSPVETGKIKLSIPPSQIFNKFGKLADPIYQRLVKNAVENQKLTTLRDLLLSKLMSGEIRV